MDKTKINRDVLIEQICYWLNCTSSDAKIMTVANIVLLDANYTINTHKLVPEVNENE